MYMIEMMFDLLSFQDDCTPPNNEFNNSISCSGHGTCEFFGNGGYQCICYSGFTGPYCQYSKLK